jgi:hypothetical protein
MRAMLSSRACHDVSCMAALCGPIDRLALGLPDHKCMCCKL